jgi:hypothetical protein
VLLSRSLPPVAATSPTTDPAAVAEVETVLSESGAVAFTPVLTFSAAFHLPAEVLELLAAAVF